MVNWIEYHSEPSRLLLAWQAPDHMGNRFRWAVGELALVGKGAALQLRYFREGDEFAALNDSKPYDSLVKLGYDGYPAFSLKKDIHVEGVDDVFLRRLPPANRPDFVAYKSQFRVPADTQLSLMALLAVTEGKLPSDGFSVVDPLDGDIQCIDLMLEVAGYRHYAKGLKHIMTPGLMVDICGEPGNSHDEKAVRFCVDDETIGYVNRLQTGPFHKWMASSQVTAVVERLNGRPERPRLFVFVRVRPREAAAA